MLSLYFDDDFVKHPRAELLRAAGFDVVIPRDVQTVGADDAIHLETAMRLGCVLISHNVADFQRIHRERLSNGLDHAGIILAVQRLNLSGAEIVRRLTRIDELFQDIGFVNQILFIGNFGEVRQ